jgi:hypothetical protein
MSPRHALQQLNLRQDRLPDVGLVDAISTTAHRPADTELPGYFEFSLQTCRNQANYRRN